MSLLALASFQYTTTTNYTIDRALLHYVILNGFVLFGIVLFGLTRPRRF